MSEIEHAELQHAEDIQDMGGELARLTHAYRIACTNLIEITEQRAKLTKALDSALILIDAMMRGFREHDVEPPRTLTYAKANFEAEMRKLLDNPDVRE